MGRQISFYKGLDDEKQFFQFIHDIDGIVLPYASASQAFKPVEGLPEPSSTKFWRELWLCRKEDEVKIVAKFVTEQWLLFNRSVPVKGLRSLLGPRLKTKFCTRAEYGASCRIQTLEFENSTPRNLSSKPGSIRSLDGSERTTNISTS